jgi:serine/threonine protein kinase
MAVPSSAILACPSENALAAFAEKHHASGACDGAFDAHFEQCPGCRSALIALLSAQRPRTMAGGSEPSSGPRHRAVDAPIAPGVRVGRYVIERRIGSGGMGAVYAARDPDLHRSVALKLLRADLASDGNQEALRRRLLREAQAMARLSCPNVIALYDVGTFGDQLFIAMELVEGGTLRQWLGREERSWRAVLDAFLQAAAGLAGAHAAGLVHRDFKPDNVLVGTEGRVRVTDFGLAREIAHDDVETSGVASVRREAASLLDAPLTRTGALVGTPAYMAPEQLRGGAADARSDVFAFCVALYEAVYKQRPFAGATVDALHAEILAGRVRPAPRGSKVPPWVRRALIGGLCAAPEERHASMQAVITALTPRSSSRVRVASGAAAALLAVGLLVAGVARSTEHAASGPTSAPIAATSSSVPAAVTGTSIGSPASAPAPEATHAAQSEARPAESATRVAGLTSTAATRRPMARPGAATTTRAAAAAHAPPRSAITTASLELDPLADQK